MSLSIINILFKTSSFSSITAMLSVNSSFILTSFDFNSNYCIVITIKILNNIDDNEKSRLTTPLIKAQF